METAKRLEAVSEYYFSQKLREIEQLKAQGKDVINLGIGSPDLPPHPDVVKVLSEEALKPYNHSYQSYKGSSVLRQAIKNFYKKSYDVHLNAEDEILPLIGSKEGIIHICMAFLQEGDVALVPNPGYPAYRSSALLAGATYREYILSEENNWLPDLSEIEKMGLQGVKIMFVNYPHMPTGKLPDEVVFDKLVAFAKKHNILLVNDNAYSFILNKYPQSILHVEGAGEVAIELNSLSKSHNMAGWRVGMLCGKKCFIDAVLKYKSNMDSGMFLPVQLAAAKAMESGVKWFGELNSYYALRRGKAMELLSLLGCTFDKNGGGLFVWAKVPVECKDGYSLSDEILYNAGVFITPGGIFGSAGNSYIRISLCNDMLVFDEAISRIVHYKNKGKW